MFRFALAVTLFSTLCSSPMLRAEEPVPIEEEPQHKLRFENSHVRFFDVRLPPGYRGVMHIHHHDGVFVNIEASATEAEDWGKAPVTRPGRTPGESYFIGYGTRPKAHRVSNAGVGIYHVIDTEILAGCGGAAPADDSAAGPVVTDNPRVRVSRIELEPGASTTLHGPCGMLVAVTRALITIDAPGGTERIALDPAGFKWRDSRQAMTLTNVGQTPLLAIDILVK